MVVGTKVRLKSGEGPLMTVVDKTAAGYIVCAWNALDGTPQKKMFFPELIKKVAAVPPPTKGR
jgi:uncharacterized protein YodC (DUF2158 family)